MKSYRMILKLAVITIFLSIFAIDSVANWKKTDNESFVKSDILKSERSVKSDTLPEGISQDWLKDLRDENGNSINIENNNNSKVNIPEDPEGDALQRKVFTGFNTGNEFGTSVSKAGDVNGDGYGDIMISTEKFNSSTGRVYIYFGGLNMNTVPDVILNGEAIADNFGRNVSSAGDVNGDGFSDVIVGAYLNDAGGSNAGRAYIYFGGISMNNVADITFTGQAINEFFGFAISSAGDVNGDGYSDVFVGAYAINSGKAYIYYGGSSMNNVADVVMTGEASQDLFGFSLSSAGDINGDGYDDVIAGAYGNDAGGSNAGRAYVYFGGSVMNNAADVIMTGEVVSDFFGSSVSSAGDVNGDGYFDIVIGAYNNDEAASNAGKVYIYFGGSTVDNVADVSILGQAANDNFGFTVSSAGDVNGDGFSDIIISGHNNDEGGLNAGKAYVYFGGVLMNTVPDITIVGQAAGDAFGRSVSSAGDVNGDGLSDILVGAHLNDAGGSNAGRAYLYDYFMKNIIVPDIVMTGDSSNSSFGISVSNAGDVNGDGISDVLVGAYSKNSYKGKAYLYFGGVTMDNVADAVFSGEASNNSFGFSVSSAGDVNGDGYSDIIIGAVGYNSSTGRAYIYFGGSVPDIIADVILNGELVGDYFGYSVSIADDVNGDGYSDVIVGAHRQSSIASNAGKAYIYYGGSFMNNVADVNLIATTVNELFGYSVSTAGDVNADGYSDVIIGAKGHNSNTGIAYLFLGGFVMNNLPDLTFTGEFILDYFGTTVSDAGDFNKDGYSDVIISAPENNNYIGKAYLYYGGPVMNNTTDLTFTGEYYLDYFGISASDAGDINGDGFSDLIISAEGNDQSGTNSGKAYIYYGGIDPDNVADFVITGDTIGERLGSSVSSAGDLNNDGYSDIILGAYEYNIFRGKANIYLGSAIAVKPNILYVKDVPNDQGGKVNLKWARSGIDVQGNSLITDYLIQRSFPPSGGNFSWQNISTVPASHESFYSYIDNTPFDSSSNNSGNFFYRITARTSEINQSWKSNIIAGRSIDNISPPMVSPFNAFRSGADVILNWNRNPAQDLFNYILFRNTNPTIDPYTETPYAAVTDSVYTDTSPLSGKYYYFIVAQDIHNNYSPVAVTTSPAITLNLTMFIEGFYSEFGDSQVADRINVFLRNSVSPFALKDSALTEVQSDGSAILHFNNAPSGNYYIVVKHRNSIETWSSAGIAFTAGDSVNYNFTSTYSQAFGNNLIQVDSSPVRFALYSGDVNQDGIIDVTDGSLIDNDAFNFASGNLPTDLNGDEIIDLADAVFADNNAFNFVSAVTP